MKIINPIYDRAFKYLMENEKFARKVLSVILDQEVEEVSFASQELLFPESKHNFMLFRLDFRAVIREADGSTKTVLIELQKSKYSSDIQRFRNYLGANYISTKGDRNKVEESPLNYRPPFPIITIYILGYNLDDLPYMAVTVNRDVINSVNKEKISVKSSFIELLTHQSHIIQIRRLPDVRRTRLEQFFSLFDQKQSAGDNYALDIPEVPEEFTDMARYLQGPLMDEDFRRQIDVEEEIDYLFDEQQAKFSKQYAELEAKQRETILMMEELKLQEEESKQREEEAKQREEEAKQREEETKQREEEAKQREEEAKQREEEARLREEEAKFLREETRTQKKVLALKLARLMARNGATADDIFTETGLNPDDYA